MKTLLLLIFTALTLATQAQTSVYYPLPSNARWRISYFDICCSNQHLSCDEIEYFSGADTIINSLTYHSYIKTVFMSQFCYSYPSGTYFTRDDSVAKKVYVNTNGVDSLLYDYNLIAGDTIKGYLASFSFCSPKIGNVDSIIIDGKWRKRWNIAFASCSSQNRCYIEGIGTNGGLIESYFTFEKETDIECFSINGRSLYPDTSIACYLLGINDLSLTSVATVFPNPATNLVTITTTSTQLSQIILFDITSRQLMQQKFNGSATLNIANLAKGVYLYEVRDENGLLKQGKVVKE